MIELKNLSFSYANSTEGAIRNVSLKISAGECVLLCGESGCGKTTVTRLINGLIPHYYEGQLQGSVCVNDMKVPEMELYQLAPYVGSVFQNPRSQFFCVDTTSEIAFGCENMGMSRERVNWRIKEAAAQLDINDLLGRNIFSLSGGEKQKIACASVSAMEPDIFVLDEPTSNLDQKAIEDLKKTLLLWKAQGKTIVIAEHRLYWLKEICDRVIYMDKGEVQWDMPMGEFKKLPSSEVCRLGLRSLSLADFPFMPWSFSGKGSFTIEDLSFSYGKKKALSIPELSLPLGAVVAVIGHNGAGKSTFSKCLSGLGKGVSGRVRLNGEKCSPRKLLKKSYMVMQDVNHQLFCETVEDEIVLGMSREQPVDPDRVLAHLDLDSFKERHPMSLSGGQKQRVAVASAILADKEILIFDEPTSGLDFSRMEQTAEMLLSLCGERTVFIVTHDPELIVRCCTHVVHLEQGTVAEVYPLTPENKTRFMGFFTGGAGDEDKLKEVVYI